jgi:AcrR family transcriptional regulator
MRMPPRVNFTAEEIIKASMDVIRNEGSTGLTSRNIAKAMGGSTQPIYRVFGTIEKLKKELFEAGREMANEIMLSSEDEQSYFLSIGMGYLKFCREEPELFTYTFIENGRNSILDYSKESFQAILEKMKKDPTLKILHDETLKNLHRDMWIYTHGIASQILTDPDIWSEEICRHMLFSMGGRLIAHEILKAKENFDYENILKETDNEDCSS